MSATMQPTTTQDAIAQAAQEALNLITVRHTGFPNFEALIEARGGYRPSMPVIGAPKTGRYAELRLLADAYDTVQALRGDLRRAYRCQA